MVTIVDGAHLTVHCVFLCCCVFVVKQLLNNWMGAMAGLPPGSATVTVLHRPMLSPGQQHDHVTDRSLASVHEQGTLCRLRSVWWKTILKTHLFRSGCGAWRRRV